MFDFLQHHGLQRARFPVLYHLLEFAHSCPVNLWCHPTISSSVVHFSCLLSFPALGSFLMSQLFTSGGQSIRASTLASVLPMNIQSWLPWGLTGWISFSPRDSQVSPSTIIWKHQFFSTQSFLCPTLTSIDDYWKNHSFDCTNLCWQWYLCCCS